MLPSHSGQQASRRHSQALLRARDYSVARHSYLMYVLGTDEYNALRICAAIVMDFCATMSAANAKKERRPLRQMKQLVMSSLRLLIYIQFHTAPKEQGNFLPLEI